MKFLAPLMWIIVQILSLVLFIAGLIVIPIALACGAYAPASDTYHWTWRWMWLWDNAEDGLAPDTYRVENKYTVKRGIFMWSAIRNSVNNLQRVKYLNCTMDPAAIKVTILSHGFYCRQGIYAGGQLYVGSKEINFGYALVPVMTMNKISPGYYVPGTRNVPYVSQYWSIGPIGSDVADIERHA